MENTRRHLLQTALIAAPALLLPRRSFAAPKSAVSIYHTNDTHSRIDPFERGIHQGKAGVARRATLVSKLREQTPQHLLVDAGDVFQGTPWFNRYRGEIEIKMMKALGYDAMCLGNHEFDAGMQQLYQALSHAPSMPILNANYDTANTVLKDRVKACHIFERGPIKIGVFGLGIALVGLVSQKMCAGVSYTDPREAANKCVEILRGQGCHLVVALSHLGHMGYQGEVGDMDWPKDVSGVDYVVGGHTHTLLQEPLWVKHRSGNWETPVLQVGHSGLWLGAAHFEVSEQRAWLRSSGPRLC
jgi:5'-nucleotidase